MATDMEAVENRATVWKQRAEEAEKQYQVLQHEFDQLTESHQKAITELENNTGGASESEEALAEIQRELEALKAQHSVAVSQNKSAAQQAEMLRAKVAELEQSLQQAPTPETIASLQSQFEQEQERANLLQEKLDNELAKGTKVGLARQLADALRENEELQEELRQARQDSEKDAADDTPRPPLTKKDLKEVMASLSPDKRRNLAEILLTAGVLNQEQLHRAQSEQKAQPDATLPGILLSSNIVDETTLAEAISLQTGLPLVSLNDDTVNAAAVNEIPQRIARMYHCILMRSSADQIEVALANPGNILAIEDIERVTGKQVSPKVALRSEIETAIEKYYWEPE